MRNDYERLLDIQEAIQNIYKYADRGKNTFEDDEFRNSHTEIQWSKIIGMRNILVHDYFSIDKAIVWAAVENELPILKTHIEKIIDKNS